jgi:glycosyltransferase involved in cell wall biosynthesis
MQRGSNPIIVIAPYLPESVPGFGSLAAAHKIESVVRILARSGRRIIFINSAHLHCDFAPTSASTQTIGGVKVAQLTPFTARWRPVGKALNILAASRLAKRLARLQPSLVWIYNSYAFEARTALLLAQRTGCKIVLQLEDLPRARRRGLLDMKPRLDSRYLHLLESRATLITCVNSSVESILQSVRTLMLPYIMSPFVNTNGIHPFESQPYVLGYFGGLTREKGASILAALCSTLPEPWRMMVTGRGDLAPALRRCAEQSAGRMQFFENVPDKKLFELLSQCDVVVNPHTSIEAMGQGVFPFKVLEAIAAGRLVISTELPPCGFDLSENVIPFDGTLSGLLSALKCAPEFFVRRQPGLISIVGQVRSTLSEDAVYATLRGMEVLP